MKILLLLVALTFSLNSCTTEHLVPDNYDHQGTWELARTKNYIANAEYNEQPELSESYIFRQNGTFLKIRGEGTSEESAGGTYKLVNREWTGAGEPLLFLDLRFESDSPLISNCTSEPVEHLILTSGYILINTWIACDGNQVEYEKAEQPDA